MEKRKKILIIRLSSFGDVILARDAFSRVFQTSLNSTPPKVDWLVKENFSQWIEQTPGVERVLKVPDQISFKKWINQIQKLQSEEYDEIIDLHRTLRSFILRAMWKLKCPETRQHKISKERFRLWGLFIFKKLWPKQLMPTPWWLRYERTFKKSQLFNDTENTANKNINLQKAKTELKTKTDIKKHFVLMPSSRWPGKEWPVSEYVKLIQETGIFPVILGQEKDLASLKLVQTLIENKTAHRNCIGVPIAETTEQIETALAYIGCDTGLAHLAESLATPVLVVLGPTNENSGFAPRLKNSQTFGSSLWCRPCSKDGSACFRLWNRYQCLTDPSENLKIRTEIRDHLVIFLQKSEKENS